MLKKLLRYMLMVLSLVTVTTMMSACSTSEKGKDTSTKGSDQSNTSTDSGSNEDIKAVEDEPKDPLGKYEPGIKLRGAYFVSSGTQFIKGNPDYDSPEQNLFIKDYKDYLGIDVVYDWVSADVEAYDTKWNMAMAQDNLPDFGLVNETQYKMLLEAGLVMDMTDIFDQYASEKYKEFITADGGATLGYSTQNGRMMGLPLTGAQPDTVPILFIRKDWLDELDLSVPTPIEELEVAAKAFVENQMGGPDTYGFVGSKNAFEYDLSFRGILNGYGAYPGAWVKDSTGKIVYGSTTDSVKSPLLKLQEWYKTGLINEDFAVTDQSIAKEDVAAGKVGIAFGTYYIAPGVGDAASGDEQAEWAIVELPTADGAPAIAQSTVKRTQFIFVNKNCKYPEAVVKLVNLGIDLIYNDDPETVARHTSHLVGDTGVQTSKYVATVFYCQIPWQNLKIQQDVVNALNTGNKEWTIPIAATKYELALQYEAGDRSQWNQYHIFGPTSTFTVIKNMWDEGRIILDEYQTLPTETMTAKYQLLDDALKTAMIKVIMGEDISVYESAVQDWFKNGGQAMTDEVNTWYSQK